MLKDRKIDFICIAAILAACIMAALFLSGEKIGITPLSSEPGYSSHLFDDSHVHHIAAQGKCLELFNELFHLCFSFFKLIRLFPAIRFMPSLDIILSTIAYVS